MEYVSLLYLALFGGDASMWGCIRAGARACARESLLQASFMNLIRGKKEI